MFKCKQCGHQFGANVPAVCPKCGAKTNRPEDMSNRTILGLFLFEALGQTVIFAILVGIVVALAIKYL